jgi:hypothetical protein
MENMDNGLNVPKWVLISWPKIPQMPQNLSAKIVYQSKMFGILLKKGSIGTVFMFKYCKVVKLLFLTLGPNFLSKISQIIEIIQIPFSHILEILNKNYEKKIFFGDNDALKIYGAPKLCTVK